MGAGRALALCHSFLGMTEYFRGRFRPALAHLEQARRLYAQVGARAGEAITCQRMVMAETALGEFDAGRAHIHEGLAVAEGAPMRSHCRARLFAALGRNRLEAGDHAGLQEAAAAGLEAAAAHSGCSTCSGLLYPVAIMAGVTAGELAAAEAHLRQATAAGGHPFVRGLTQQAAAFLAAAQGRWETAFQALTRSRRAFLAMSHYFEAARCDLFAAQFLLQRGGPADRPAARRLAARALPLFTRMEAAPMVAAAQAALATAGEPQTVR